MHFLNEDIQINARRAKKLNSQNSLSKTYRLYIYTKLEVKNNSFLIAMIENFMTFLTVHIDIR